MEVIINGTVAELGQSMPALTKKSIDINNPSARFIDFSNRFDLPFTLPNSEIFEVPRVIGSNNRSFDQLYEVSINDVFNIFRGQGFLDSSVKNSFAMQVIDRGKELFKSLEIKLNEISWDAKDTDLSQTEIAALDATDLTNCWYWGKACYHENAIKVNTDQTTGDARCKYSRPAFYVQALLKAAIENAGYTFTTALPDLAISSNHKRFFFTSYQKTIDTTYNPSGTLAMTGLDTNDFEHADLTTTSTTIAIGTKKTIFRLRGVATSSATIILVITATDDVDSSKVIENRFELNTTTEYIDFTSSEFQSDDGMTINIDFEGTGAVVFDDVLLYTLLPEKDEDLSTNPWLDYRIKAHDNLPNLTYKDLYTLICIVSNQYHIIDTYNKTFEFGSMANISKMNSVDWSDKFVQGSEKINAKISGLFQKNYLKYTNDLTVHPELGQSYFLTDNESLPAEGDYITLNFGASDECTIDSNDIAHVKIYNDTTRIEDQEIKIRLFAINSDKLQFNTIHWEYLKDTYYENWFNSLSRVRLIDCQVNISKLDFLSWHEKQLAYIEYFGSTFIVLELANFISNRLTNVKLLNYGR